MLTGVLELSIGEWMLDVCGHDSRMQIADKVRVLHVTIDINPEGNHFLNQIVGGSKVLKKVTLVGPPTGSSRAIESAAELAVVKTIWRLTAHCQKMDIELWKHGFFENGQVNLNA